MSVLDRFLRYASIDTRSDEHSATVPSTPGQLVLMRILAEELRVIGLEDVTLDTNGYLMATVPATVGHAVPVIGLVAHVDTSPEMPSDHVRPIVHERYDGRDLLLPDNPTAVLRTREIPELAEQLGHDIVTASGLTLLGADDKAGVAEIVTAADYLMRHPEIPHGAIRIAFTPDEEIGRGADHFDVARFGAVCAYTLDGGARGELEFWSFSADAMTLTFGGFNTHPGYAKGRMINAIRVASRFIDRLPTSALSPETTEGYEGFVHPYQLEASVDRAEVKIHPNQRFRDGVTGGEGGAGRTARTRSGRCDARRDARHPDRRVLPEHARNPRPPSPGARARASGDPARRDRAD